HRIPPGWLRGENNSAAPRFRRRPRGSRQLRAFKPSPWPAAGVLQGNRAEPKLLPLEPGPRSCFAQNRRRRDSPPPRSRPPTRRISLTATRLAANSHLLKSAAEQGSAEPLECG